jgi:hypothetical protein
MMCSASFLLSYDAMVASRFEVADGENVDRGCRIDRRRDMRFWPERHGLIIPASA